MNIVQGVVMCLTQCYHVCSLTLTLAGISRCPFDYKSIGTIHSRPLSLPLSLLTYIPLSPTSLILVSLISKSVRRDHLADDVEAARADADADARPEPTPMRCRKMLFPTQLQNRESRRRSCFDSTTSAIFLNQCQRHLAECPLSSLLPIDKSLSSSESY